MKKLLTFAMILALLLSCLTLPAMAEGDGEATDSPDNYPALTYAGLEFPEEFEGAELFDFFWYTDGVGVHENTLVSADGLTSFEYVYLKAYEGEDKATAFPKEEACIYVDFEIEQAGVYNFLIELMAHATDIPRTGLLQIDDGPKYYISSIHGEHHEVWEYFTGMSAYLSMGEHRMTVYLGPDFDDSTVKSLFFDNFYYLLDPDAEIPEAPDAPPMWDENKDIVKHQSFDELRKNGDSNDGVFTPGQSAGWDKTVALDGSITKLDYWGWVALADEVGSFGYQIDTYAPVYDEAFTVEAEQPVVDAAAGAGGTAASRMLIGIDVSELEGEHTVNVLYKDGDGNVVTLNTFTLTREAAAETEPEETVPESDPVETPAETEPESEKTPDESKADETKAAETEKPEEGGCASAVIALPAVVGAIAAAYVLRRKDN